MQHTTTLRGPLLQKKKKKKKEWGALRSKQPSYSLSRIGTRAVEVREGVVRERRRHQRQDRKCRMRQMVNDPFSPQLLLDM